MLSFWQTYSKPTENSFFISSLLFVAFTSYSSSAVMSNTACSICVYSKVLSRLAWPRNSCRFQVIPRLEASINRFMHVSVTLSFYILIVIHVLHGLEVL